MSLFNIRFYRINSESEEADSIISVPLSVKPYSDKKDGHMIFRHQISTKIPKHSKVVLEFFNKKEISFISNIESAKWVQLNPTDKFTIQVKTYNFSLEPDVIYIEEVLVHVKNLTEKNSILLI